MLQEEECAEHYIAVTPPLEGLASSVPPLAKAALAKPAAPIVRHLFAAPADDLNSSQWNAHTNRAWGTGSECLPAGTIAKLRTGLRSSRCGRHAARPRSRNAFQARSHSRRRTK